MSTRYIPHPPLLWPPGKFSKDAAAARRARRIDSDVDACVPYCRPFLPLDPSAIERQEPVSGEIVVVGPAYGVTYVTQTVGGVAVSDRAYLSGKIQPIAVTVDFDLGDDD